MPSHFSGVVIRRSASFRAAKSGVQSPVSSKTDFLRFCPPNLIFQSIMRSFASALSGAI